jgi:hypothetical protein
MPKSSSGTPHFFHARRVSDHGTHAWLSHVETTTKTATKRAAAKSDGAFAFLFALCTSSTSSSGTNIVVGGEKTKRAPSAYNVFVKEQMKVFKEEFPEKPHKEAMSWVRSCSCLTTRAYP